MTGPWETTGTITPASTQAAAKMHDTMNYKWEIIHKINKLLSLDITFISNLLAWTFWKGFGFFDWFFALKLYWTLCVWGCKCNWWYFNWIIALLYCEPQQYSQSLIRLTLIHLIFKIANYGLFYYSKISLHTILSILLKHVHMYTK